MIYLQRIIIENDIPTECQQYFKSERLKKMVYDVITNSLNKDNVSMSEECFQYMNIFCQMDMLMKSH